MAARYLMPLLIANGSTVFDIAYQGNIQFIGVGAPWGSGTLILEISPDNGVTWLPIPTASWTANFIATFAIGQGCRVRGTLSGATAPSISVYASYLVGSLSSPM